MPRYADAAAITLRLILPFIDGRHCRCRYFAIADDAKPLLSLLDAAASYAT